MSAKRTPKKDLISQAQVCKRLGISERTLRRWRIAGEFGHYEFRGTIKFDAREIEAYKRGHRVGPPLPPNLDLYPLPPIIEDGNELAPVPTPSENHQPTASENGGQS